MGKFDNNLPSAKAMKQEAATHGMGVPQSTGKAVDANTFKEAPVVADAPTASSDPNALKNKHSAGTDSAVGAAGADGNIEIAGGASTGNVPPEVRD